MIPHHSQPLASTARWTLLSALLLVQLVMLAFIWQAGQPNDSSWLRALGVAALLLTLGLAGVLWRQARQGAEGTQLQDKYRYLCESLETLPVAFELYDPQERLLWCNQPMHDMYPLSERKQSLGQTYESLLRRAVALGEVPDVPVGEEDAWIEQRMANRGKASQPLLRRLSNGDWVYLYELRTDSGCLVTMRMNVTQAIHQREVMSDIARAQARVANERLHEAIEAMPAGVAIYDEEDRLVMCNSQIRDMAPYNLDGDLTGQHYEILMRRSLGRGDIAKVAGREDEWLARRLAGRGKVNGPLLRRFKGERWVHFYETRTATGCLVTVRLDVTDLVGKSLALERANAQLAKLSHTDSLTELANRRLFDECLQREWQRSARSQQPLTLLLVDIDHFKRYNDHYGHIQGDNCLHQLARILQACALRSGDLVARYGGEEFALLLPGTDARDAAQVAQHCIDELARAAIEHANSPVSQWLTISIGVATVVADARLSHLSLVRSADTALYRMKEAGRARFEVVTTLSL